MKLDPLNILLNKEFSLNKKFYFIGGNELSLMEKICTTIILKHQQDRNTVKVKIDSIESFVNEKSLFEDRKIFLLKNCKDINENNLKKIRDTDDIFIFFQENSQKTKKIKALFANDRDSFLIDCYELDNNSKVRILNKFISHNKIKIDSSLYWWLVDKLDNKYAFLENSLNKISELDQKEITTINLKKLIAVEDSGKEKIFFNLLKKNDEIIKIYREKIINSSDVNDLFYYCRFFCQLFIECKNVEEYRKKIPLYLFREKNLLIDIYRKYNSRKKKKLLKLLSSTEKLLRNQNSVSLATGLRFFLNLKKITIS